MLLRWPPDISRNSWTVSLTIRPTYQPWFPQVWQILSHLEMRSANISASPSHLFRSGTFRNSISFSARQRDPVSSPPAIWIVLLRHWPWAWVGLHRPWVALIVHWDLSDLGKGKRPRSWLDNTLGAHHLVWALVWSGRWEIREQRKSSDGMHWPTYTGLQGPPVGLAGHI